MKKLLSICFLSMLLMLAGFTAKAQVTTNCCFWLENMQPDTLHDVSNVAPAPGMFTPGSPAYLPGQGNDLILYNSMSRVDNVNHISISNGAANYIIGDRTDWYRINFTNNCNLPASTKVSVEWKLYNNGVLIPDAQLSDYVDVFIFTKFDQRAHTDNVMGECGHNGWLGGPVYGNGVCGENQGMNGNDAAGGYPGSVPVIDNDQFPYAAYGFGAAGYVRQVHTYNLDYFYINFFESSETRIALRWKQVGNYSLVVGLRERTNGSAFAIWDSDYQNGYIGGHQSHCGALLAQDSIHYLVNTTSQMVTCENDPYHYGSPEAVYTQTGFYNVLFGEYTCGHWRVDSLDLLDFQTRINPDIIAHNDTICQNVPVTAAWIESLAPAVNTDAPGLVSYQRYWKLSTDTGYTTTPVLFDNTTVGDYLYYVYQVNTYDTIPGFSFDCIGDTTTFIIRVNEFIPPVLDNTNPRYAYCNEDITPTSTQVIKAILNNNNFNHCAQQVHWFQGTTATGTPVSTTGTYTVNLSSIYNPNFNHKVTYTAFSYAETSPGVGTYSPTGVSVEFQFWATPEVANNTSVATQENFVVCPHTTGIQLRSNFIVTNTNATTGVGNNYTWTYTWKKNGQTINYNQANYTVTAPGCGVTDTFVVTAVAHASHPAYPNDDICEATITRTFTVKGEDTDPISITWRNASTAAITISGCDSTTSAWSAPYTINNAVESTTGTSPIRIVNDKCHNKTAIHYSVSVNTTLAPCTTTVTRSYYITDECNNSSNTISQVVTIVNDSIPVLTGKVDTVNPVRILNNDCKDNLPARNVLLTSLHNNFNIHSACGSATPDSLIRFYIGNTEVALANGNPVAAEQDIFANTDEVHVTVRVEDECHNITPNNAKIHVITLLKPAAINIAHGATRTPDYEVCNYDTVVVIFDTNMIYNGFSPYQYSWDQDPKPDECGIIHLTDTSIRVYALVGGAYYTSTQFIMNITDKYGCKASDTSNAIHFFPVPTVNLVEDSRNDDYAHPGAVPVVCPTFGHYLLDAQATDNLPLMPYDHTLTYVWSGEAIDYTSTTNFSFIAVNENVCDRVYTAYVDVTNSMGCITRAEYSIHAIDTLPPVITLAQTTDTIAPNAPNCGIIVPNYAPLFNVSTVTDDCWNMDSTRVTQVPAAGDTIYDNTNVVITVSPKCGPSATHTIRVCYPEPRFSTTILASVDSSCYPYTSTLSVISEHGTQANVVWDNKVTATTLDVSPIEGVDSTITHTVAVYDVNNCLAADTIQLVVYHKPVAADVNVVTTANNYCDTAVHSNGSITITAVHGDIDSIRLHGETEWHALPYVTNDTVKPGTYLYDLLTIHGCLTEQVVNVLVPHDTTLPASYLDSVLAVEPYTHNDYCTAPWHGTLNVLYPVDGYTYYMPMHVNLLDDGVTLDTCGNETHIYNSSLESDLWFNYLYQGTDYRIYITTNYNCHYVTGPDTIRDQRTTPPVPHHVVVANSVCGSSNGSITFLDTDPKYYYTLNGITYRGVQSGVRAFTNLPAGDYNLHIYNDITRCEFDTLFTVPDSSNGPVFNDSEVALTHRTNCVTPNGSIQITAQTGMAFVVFNAFGDTVQPANYNSLDSGNYTIYKVELATGCSTPKQVHINFNKPVVNLTATQTTPDKDCSDLGTGVINVTATPSANIFFKVINSTNDTMNPSFTGLNNDTYTVHAYNTVTNCEYTKPVTVASQFHYPEVTYTSTANYMCYAEKNGTITAHDTLAARIAPTTPNYNTSFVYIINGTDTVNVADSLNSGHYMVSVMTNLHCTTTPVDVEVLDSAWFLPQYQITPNSTCDITLSRPGNGQIKVLTPQTTHHLYVFTYIDTIHYGYDVDHFEPIDYTKFTLADGHYQVFITDTITGCTHTDTVFVPFTPTPLAIDSIVPTIDYSCKAGLSLGTITVTAHSSSAAAVLSYSIDGGTTYQLDPVFTGVPAGSYQITILDTVNNCVYDTMANRNVDVLHDQYELVFSVDTTPNHFCDTTRFDGSITLTVLSNANPDATTYMYSIDNGVTYDTVNVFTGLKNGIYNVAIMDMFTECVYDSVAIIRLDNNHAPSVVINGPNHICKNEDGTLYAEVTTTLPGDTVFTYKWYNDCPSGVILSTTDSCKILTDMVHCCTYTVEVTSVLTGCTTVESMYVCVDSLPLVHFIVNGTPWTTRDPNNFFNCENNPIDIAIDSVGLVSHVWTNGVNTSNASFTVPAYDIAANATKSFCVTIVDNNGCTTTDAINVISKPIFRDTVDIDACGSYIYTYVAGGSDTLRFDPAGTNVHQILDIYTAANGCDSFMVYNITISAPPTLTVSATIPASICEGDTILPTGEGFTHDYAIQYGWRIVSASTTIDKSNCITAGSAFNINDAVSEGMTGMSIYAYSANNCDTLFSAPTTLKVTNIPSLIPSPAPMANDTICAGNTVTIPALNADSVNWHGTTTGNECKIEYKNVDSLTWNTWATGTVLAKGEYAFRFVAKNDCSGDFITLDTMGVFVAGSVTVAIDNDHQVICLGQPITTINVTTTNARAMVAGDVVFTPATTALTFDPAAMTISGSPATKDTIYVAITAYTDVVGSPCPFMTIYDTIVVNDTVKLAATPMAQTLCVGNEIAPIAVLYENATISTSTLPTGLTLVNDTIKGAPAKIKVNENDTLTITITATSNVVPACDPVKTVTVQIVVFDTVKVNSTLATQEFCVGTPLTNIVLDYDNATINAINLPSGVALDNDTIKGIPLKATTNPSDTFEYKIAFVSLNGCENDTLTGKIIVHDTVKLTVAPLADTLCLGNSIKPIVVDVKNGTAALTTLKPAIYTMVNDTINGTPDAFGNDTLTITATSTFASFTGCDPKEQKVVIYIRDTVSLNVTPLTQTFCLGEAITPVVMTYANATLTVPSLATGLTHIHTTPGKDTISGTPEQADTLRYTVVANSIYNPACDAKSALVTIIVNDTVKLSADPLLLDQTVCRLDTIDTIAFTVENATLSVDGGVLPTGLIFNSTTNKLYGVPEGMNVTGDTIKLTATSTAYPPCGEKKIQVVIKVNDKPSITGTIIDGILDVCEGLTFTKPSDLAIDTNGLPTDTIWKLATETGAFDWTAAATMAMNAQKMYYIATNYCGADTVDTVMVVYPRPVPQIAADTYICLDGSASMTETTSYPYISYKWMDANGTTVATTKNYTFDASSLHLTTDSLFTFTLEVVDTNNCVSLNSLNASTDILTFHVDTAVSVMATDKPRFRFTHAGSDTHNIDALTTDNRTEYTWTVDNTCGIAGDVMVFVTFDIYRNDTLLSNSNIGHMIRPATAAGGTKYVSYDVIHWQTPSHVDVSATSYFNYAVSSSVPGSDLMGNHYPNKYYSTIFPYGQDYDEVYLHFLAGNPVDKTFNQFLKSGEYKIVYRLISTTQKSILPTNYYNADSTANLSIGGNNSLTAGAIFDTLRTDELYINVTGPDQVSAGGFSLLTTDIEEYESANEDNASMVVYPNPTNNVVNARINGVTGESTINVVNIAGQIVARDNVVLDGTEYIYRREVRNLTPGVYFIRVEGENVTLSKKLVISK